MPLFALLFFIGDLFVQTFTTLPHRYWIIVIIILILSGLIFVKIKPEKSLYAKILLAFLLGFGWSLWFAATKMLWNLPVTLEGKPIAITGQIVSLPVNQTHGTAFIFSVDTLTGDNKKQIGRGLLFHPRCRLNWQGDHPLLQVGDQWQLAVKVKRIHGLFNPGGFDYEAWAMQEGIRMQGYVINNSHPILLASHWHDSPLDRFRQYLKDKIALNLPVSQTSPWITALILGERDNIHPDQWEILRNTGTNHLMAIAGLHIGFMAGFLHSLVAWGWRRFPYLVYKIPAQHAGAMAALFVAGLYSALAGFAIPTERACIMLAVFLITTLLNRKIIAWQAWSIALCVILLLNPQSVLSSSFWLSLGSVALIIYGISGRLSAHGLWWKWGRTQWVIALGLIPFSIALFQQFSVVSFAANSIAIPWVGCLIVPLCLIGALVLLFSSHSGGLILSVADKLLAVLWSILTWFSHLSIATWHQVIPNQGIIFLACLSVIFLLLPIGFPGRYFGLVWFLPLIFYAYPTPKTGDVWFTLLDVGQGLSAVVQTEKHSLVFDTGAKFGDSYDMGDSVLVPFLRTCGIKKVDRLVVSHQDNDHIGGAAALLKQLPVEDIKTSVPEKFNHAHVSYCLRGEGWEWDHVRFEFLYPTLDTLHLNNDSSCVLKITSHHKSILLTGDIEKFAEQNLAEAEAQKLAANIIVAPHHGSKTSGEENFLRWVKPNYVLFPVGYRNRYHFPHPTVIAKYQAFNAMMYDTAHHGAIRFYLVDENVIQPPDLYRQAHGKYWNIPFVLENANLGFVMQAQ